MSGIAHLLLDGGVAVTGSDLAPTSITEALEAKGAVLQSDHRPSLVAGADLVIVSSAVPPDNPELRHAATAGLPVLTRGEAVAELAEGQRVLAVAGTHGKTTTTAMLAWVLLEAGHDPTVLVGGIVPQISGQSRLGGSDQFVIEADEYQRSFLALEPYLLLVTHIEFDHPDYFTDEEDVFGAFRELAWRVRPDGRLITCADHPLSLRLAKDSGRAQTETYGVGEEADWRALDPHSDGSGGQRFHVAHRDRPVCGVRIHLPGMHNVRNALGALAAAHSEGVEPEEAAQALERFVGVERRFQTLGEAGGVMVIDDYAHHPTEIAATIAAARERFPERRLWAAFQPHTFSRTKALLRGFAGTLAALDRVVIADIYPAREPDQAIVHARDLADLIGPHASYGGSLREAQAMLETELGPGDVLLVLGAGDIRQVGESVLRRLQDKHGAA